MAVRGNIAALIIAQLMVGVAVPVIAADWIVQSVTGTALALQDEQWVALNSGDVLAEPFTLRTLRRAKVAVGTTDAALSLRSQTTITVVSESDLVSVNLVQGAVAAFVQGERKALLSAGTRQVDLAAGSAEIELTAQGASVRSREGLVMVRDPAAEAPVLLAPGRSANPAGLSNDTPGSPGGHQATSGSGGEAPANYGEGRGNSSGASDANGQSKGRP